MRASRFHLSTTRETPASAEIVSHQLMLRSGMIRRLAAGLYTWLPLGWRVLRKVEAIVRKELDRSGALELHMPMVQPAELWQESGRWEQYGAELLRVQDRHERAFCLGPTHEEVITDIFRNEVRSYRQLPLNFYQIQTKFRDEIRPRFGIMRAREFLMKDAYSFHMNRDCMAQTYQVMFDTYTRIFERLALEFRAVEADTGNIGGSVSHEFHVLADSGEDAIAFSSEGDYAANVELAEALAPAPAPAAPTAAMEQVDTPGARTIEDLVRDYGVPIEKTVKTLIAKAAEGGLVALIVRGDHNLNDIKATRLPRVAEPFELADEPAIRKAVGAGPGSLGPVNLPIPCVVDRTVAVMSDFAAGANEDDKHYFNINWERDVALPEVADLRDAVAGDPSPDGHGTLDIARGIEVGHIFQLGTKYSEAMQALVTDEQGREQPALMGCYGIGVSRVVAAAIEQNHDGNGIIWPTPIAPFQVALCPVNLNKSARVREAVEALYHELEASGLEVLLDDRGLRPGAMFADIELIGIPHRLVVSERGLDNNTLEYQGRRDTEARVLPREQAIQQLRERIDAELA